MTNAENLEQFAQFDSARTFAPGETLKNYRSRLPQLDVGSVSGSLSSPTLSFADDYPATQMEITRKLPKPVVEVGTTNVVVYVTTHSVGPENPSVKPHTIDRLVSGRILDESGGLMVVELQLSDESTATLSSSLPRHHTLVSKNKNRLAWIGDRDAVLTRAKRYLSEACYLRLKELFNIKPHEDQEPLKTKSAGWLVRFCMHQRNLKKPLMAPTPNGELDATWRNSAGEVVLIRFFPTGTIWVIHKLRSDRGSSETTVQALLSNKTAFKLPTWINA